MRGQALRQAARLARRATTLGEATGNAPCSAAVDSLQAGGGPLGSGWLTAGPQQAWAVPSCSRSYHASAAAATAATSTAHQRWRQGGAAGLAVGRGVEPTWQAAAPDCQQQRRAASAQAEPSVSSSSEAAPAGGGSGLSLSDAAVERLKELQGQSQGRPVMLRVTVEGGGCSGFQYEFDIDETGQLGETDRLFEREGVRVVCDDISLEFLKGAMVDFESDLMRSAFVIHNNPNAASSCGCGSSFVAK